MRPWTPTLGLNWLEKAWRALTAPALLVLSFALLISIGTGGLLLLPGLIRGAPLSFIDALFTMTSAACVTGLSVVDTGTRFTRAGQAWLLLFVQLGGLGLITLSTLIIGAMGRRLSLRSEMLGAPQVDISRRRSVPALAWAVTRTTLLLEGLGAVALWILWLPKFGPLEAAWHATFHSVSAFCNAGFSTFSDSLVGFQDRPLTLLVLSALIIVGGIGYLSGEETLRWWRAGRTRGSRRMSSHTYAVLVVTVALLACGWVLFALFEWNGVLRDQAWGIRLLNAWFMSVTARTAGFNTVSYAEVSNASGYLTVLLMMVGGSPGSTAGGIKTTTLAILAALALSRTRGRRYVELHGRAVPEGTVDRTVSLALMAFTIVTVAIFLISFTEASPGADLPNTRASFLPLFFEAVSAFATVGLSMDYTVKFSPSGRFVLILLMFIGRVGLLSFFAAISLRAKGAGRQLRPAHEDVVVG